MSVLNPNMTLADFADHFDISLNDLEDWAVSQFDKIEEDKDIIDIPGFHALEGDGFGNEKKRPHLSLVSSYLVGKYKF